MTKSQEIITIFGGAGFVGQYIVKDAARQGYRLRIIVRDIEAAAHLKTQGDVGQISLIPGDITKPESYETALEGAHIVINLVGILFEKGKQNFSAIHSQAAEKLAQNASKAGVTRFLHMSALGVDKAKTSKYAKTKLAGEKAVLAAFPDATIFCPSVIFGEEDNFYNQFAQMAVFSPALPLIGGGKAKFQPVYVCDVAKAFIAALDDDASCGTTYELGGADIVSFKEVLASINSMTHRNRHLLNIPSCFAGVGAFFAEFLPTPPLTRDQVELLKYDNVVSKEAPNFKTLGIEPASISSIVPDYLQCFAKEIPDAA